MRPAIRISALILASVLFGLLLCEAGLRLFTHYRPGTASESAPAAITADKPLDLEGAVPYIARLPASPGTDRAWFKENPPSLPNRLPVKADEEARYKDYQKRGIFAPQADYVWNRLFVEATMCAPASWFRNYPHQVLVFDPPSGNTHPIYRFPTNVTTSSGLVTNQFGLRGPPLSLIKPPKTVRVAFVGASTTVNNHNFPFSYPERVVGWLNRFASANHLDAHFEVLNAGREGINSEDIPPIVRYELLPLDPDLVVYYEGSNQFPSANLLVSPAIPARTAIDPGDPVVAHKVPVLLRSHLATANLLDLALNGFSSIGEPRKPLYRLQWPKGVNERNPDPDSPNLPLQLPIIVRDLDSIRTALAATGARFALCSFEWFTPEGITLSPTRHQFIYKQLNTVLWPLRYADIRRLADFQNRVFSRYAESRKIPFIDIANALPQDPNLFTDAIHMTDTGERVKAWIVFQQLAPLLRREIESGQLPRANGTHALPPAPSLTASEMVLDCFSKPTGQIAVVNDGLSIYRREPASPDAKIEPGQPLKITTSAQQFAFAVSFRMNVPSAPSGRLFVHLRARATSGQIGIGVLDRTNNSFMVEKNLSPLPEMTDTYIPVPAPSRASALIIRNGALGGVRSELLIDSIELVSFSDQKRN